MKRIAHSPIGTALPGRPILTAAVGRTRARIFVTTAESTAELIDLAAPATRGGRYHSDRGDAPGRGEKHYHHRINRERAEHYGAIAAELRRLLREYQADSFVAAGAPREVAAFTASLGRDLADALLGTVALGPGRATPARVRTLTLALEASAARVVELTRVREAIANVGRGVLHFR